MKYKNLIIFFFSFFILVFNVNADPTEEFNKKIEEKYNEIIGLYPFQERRNDIGVFYDFAWNKENKIITIKRDKQNYPIIRFSLFNKDVQQGASVKKYNNINLRGFMGMASFTEDDNLIKKQFDKLNNFFMQKKKLIETVDTLSMGMSNDYKLALKCGSNMIRIGSKIFGERNYQ